MIKKKSEDRQFIFLTVRKNVKIKYFFNLPNNVMSLNIGWGFCTEILKTTMGVSNVQFKLVSVRYFWKLTIPL